MSNQQQPSQQPQKSWQARISEATDALAASFVESISYDRRLYKHDIAGSIAHATMLAKVGLISDADLAAIKASLESIQKDIESNNFHFDESLEDIHMVIEAELTKRIGEPARRLHTGRSRNDQVAFDFSLWIWDAATTLGTTISDLCRALVVLAERSADIVMPSYTHVQRAQPISAGAEALAWARMFDRDMGRVLACRAAPSGFFDENELDSPLGSGAIAGTSLPIDPDFTRKQLSFDPGAQRIVNQIFPGADAEASVFSGPPRNSIERTASRDHACDFVYACAMISMHLSRLAEQWILYMSTEFSFLHIADRYTTSSSMMPQKRNPDMLELIRGRCGNVYGDLVALLTILKGLPIGYNRDLQEDKRIVFRAYDTVSSCLTMAAAIVNSASYRKDKIEPTLDRGFLDATSLAEYLVTQGVPFRTAHHIVGTLVARCEKEGKHALSQLPLETFNEVVQSSAPTTTLTKDVYTALGARNVVARYKSAGAAGGDPFRQQLAAWKQRLNLP